MIAKVKFPVCSDIVPREKIIRQYSWECLVSLSVLS